MRIAIMSMLLCAIAAVPAVDIHPDVVEVETVKTTWTSLITGDAATFRSVCDETMAKAMTDKVVAKLNAQLVPQVADQVVAIEYQGYAERDFGRITWWKARVTDGPDILIEMTITKGLVAGYFVK